MPQTEESPLTLLEIKELLLFCRDNGCTAIKVGDFEAHVLPPMPKMPEIPFTLPGDDLPPMVGRTPEDAAAVQDYNLFVGSDKDKEV
jgi:hypothetical protein